MNNNIITSTLMASWLSVEIEICVPGVDDGSDPEKFVAPQFIYDLGWANWRQLSF